MLSLRLAKYTCTNIYICYYIFLLFPTLMNLSESISFCECNERYVKTHCYKLKYVEKHSVKVRNDYRYRRANNNKSSILYISKENSIFIRIHLFTIIRLIPMDLRAARAVHISLHELYESSSLS